MKVYYTVDLKGRLCTSCREGILVTYGRARRHVMCSHCSTTMQRYVHINETTKEKDNESVS